MDRKIIHLDDHNIFLTGAQKVLKNDFHRLYYLCFQETGRALRYIENSIEEDCPIDLIITDLNHPGLNGYGFARQIRFMEQQHSRKTPILLLTMSTEDHPLVVQGLKEKVFDFYLPKYSSVEEISRVVQFSFDRIGGSDE